MAELHYNERVLHSIEDESVLDCLLRHEVNYPHACRFGICQACLVKTTDSPIESKWQESLPDTLKSQGYFLACQAKPTHTIHLKEVSVVAGRCNRRFCQPGNSLQTTQRRFDTQLPGVTGSLCSAGLVFATDINDVGSHPFCNQQICNRINCETF
nr:2Fe-2S iron-sulfur cluster binding domain-containing protein [Legionellales bacterium]